ncbi:MAG: PAC2 family protein [Candidatus Bathyarchaeia archaeon]
MVCTIEITEKPKLNNPILIEGLPGIGFIANIAVLHLIRELKARRFAEIRSSSFQDLAVTTEKGNAWTPTNELYCYKGDMGNRDLILWYGNTQALTTHGQYELCGHVLDIAKSVGCNFVITLGGFRQDEVRAPPQMYAAATDSETLNEALSLGAKIMVGQIFGLAGITIGVGKLKGFKGFSLLVETLGTHPDMNAAQVALEALKKYVRVDLSRLDVTAEEVKKILETFGVIKTPVAEEKKKEEQPFRWFI